VSEQQNGGQPAESSRSMAQPQEANEALFEAAIAAGRAHELSWERVGDIIDHLIQNDWLRERGHVPSPSIPSTPAERPPELIAEAERIAARWRELAAQVRAGNPPKCEWIGLSDAERRLINELHGYQPNAEQEAEAC
jgi:hypothetical protein